MKKLVMAINTIVLLVVSLIGFGASLKSMDKTQIEKAFFNNTLTSIGVDNLNGKTVDNSNSVFLDGHGKIYGKMGHKPKNNPQFDKGVYSINKDGTVYITWNHWDHAKQLCFNIFETKNAYLIVDCNNVYHSTFMKSDIRSGNQIDAN